MCLTRILKRCCTAKTRVLVDVFNRYGFVCILVNHDFSFWTLIWKASRTYNDRKFCKEPNTIIVFDKWFKSQIEKIIIFPRKISKIRKQNDYDLNFNGFYARVDSSKLQYQTICELFKLKIIQNDILQTKYNLINLCSQ